MKRILKAAAAILLLLFTLVPLAACERADVTVGIIQFANFEALNDAVLGFKDVITKWAETGGKTVTFEERNANAETTNIRSAANAVISSSPDVILAVATPCAVNAASLTSFVPILYTAVTDPNSDSSSGLTGRPNVYGTSDMNPVKQQIELIRDIVGESIRKIAVLYTTSETNSETQFRLAKEECDRLGIECVAKTVTAANEILSVMRTLDDDVDALYIPTDNIIANSMSLVAGANVRNIPVITGEKGMTETGGWASLSIDYYELGKQTAEIAVALLEGKTVPEDERHQTYNKAPVFVLGKEGKSHLSLDKINALTAKYGDPS